MGTIRSFEDLQVWQETCQFVVEIFRASGTNPSKFDRDLASQLRRASISIPSNIAEGFEKNFDKEFSRYLLIAKGSAGEVRTQLHLAKELNYVSIEKFDELNGRIRHISL